MLLLSSRPPLLSVAFHGSVQGHERGEGLVLSPCEYPRGAEASEGLGSMTLTSPLSHPVFPCTLPHVATLLANVRVDFAEFTVPSYLLAWVH